MPMSTFVLDTPLFNDVLRAAVAHEPIHLSGHTEDGKEIKVSAYVHEEKLDGGEVAFIIDPVGENERQFTSGYFPFGNKFCLTS